MTRNVLVTSAGRRVSLVAGFQDAAVQAGRQVFAADLEPDDSAACHVADAAFELPPVGAEEFADSLLSLCRRHDVGLVVPTIDPELPVLAGLRDPFAREGIQIVVSDADFIAECEDKRRTKQLFERRGLRIPALFDPADVTDYPVFVKPYDGSASAGIAVIHDAAGLAAAMDESDRLMVCEYFDPSDHDEFTIDCYYDRHSVLRCAVPRQRVEVRGGEVSKALTVRNELVDELFEQLGDLPGARGMITIQAFVDRVRRTSAYIEINARVGGGYPLSRRAGADYQAYLVCEYLEDGRVETFHDWEDRALMLRYDAEIVRFDA